MLFGAPKLKSEASLDCQSSLAGPEGITGTSHVQIQVGHKSRLHDSQSEQQGSKAS